MLLNLIFLVIQLVIWLIIIDAVLTWIPSVDRRHPIAVLIRRITGPILEPFRKVLPPEKTGYIDLSPILAIVALWILRAIIVNLAL